ncbi:AsmA family protein [Shewanella algidipiscicola]|uniref:Cell envelope biogenesis protein AsmA n=1 Tax=Shewanella algidipiscicola TaxID=614070 RepID=A0ABQ4NTD8_9GAMM|nr:AsmA family protein [Shewanella algidipiscicola]GIU02853.1 cell envelope biogenesis protein AsmA [Shewanella algidipiscicola]
MKFIKWLLLAVVTLFIALALYLTVIFDPNDFKPQIVDAVKKQTGRDLLINQDLSWTFFPAIGISLGDITLSNPQGFEHSTMVSVDGIVAEVALLPLLSKEVDIAQLNLDGLTVNLDTYKDGRSSFDGLTSTKNKQADDAVNEQAPANVQLSRLNIGGIAITNTQINLYDEASGKVQVFSLDELNLGVFSLGQLADLSYKFSASMPDVKLVSEGIGQLTVSEDLKQISLSDFAISNTIKGEGIPNQAMTVDLRTQVTVNTQDQRVALMLERLAIDSITASGKFDIHYGAAVPNVIASLAFDDINLDNLLPKSETAEATEATQATETKQEEPDLTGLKAVNLALDLSIKSIVVNNLTTNNWLMKLVLKEGVLDVKQLSAELYQGTLTSSARLDGRQAVANYRFDSKISGVKVLPLLTDAAEVDLLAGTANFNITGNGQSLISDNIKRNLMAKGQFSVTDGALYGVNIPQMLRDAKAKLSGDLNATSTGEKKTDFTSLTGSFSLAKGVFNNPDLAMASPLIRLGGQGDANIITQALDYKLTTSVVGSLEGQGGNERDALYGVEIPFAITGTMSEPEFKLDTAALFDAKLKQETDKAKDKLKDELLKKLGGF